eukprot:s136_g3.t1
MLQFFCSLACRNQATTCGKKHTRAGPDSASVPDAASNAAVVPAIVEVRCSSLDSCWALQRLPGTSFSHGSTLSWRRLGPIWNPTVQPSESLSTSRSLRSATICARSTKQRLSR